MKHTTVQGILIIIITLFVGGLIHKYVIHTCPTVDTGWVPQPQDSSGFEPQIIIFERVVNEDSIYRAAKLWWMSQLQADTIIVKDTSGTPSENVSYLYTAKYSLNKPNVKGEVRFNSRIPIDPEGYFTDNLYVQSFKFTETKELVYNPMFFIESGVVVTNELRYYGTIGANLISYKHFKIPISYEFQGAPTTKSIHQAKAGLRIEF